MRRPNFTGLRCDERERGLQWGIVGCLQAQSVLSTQQSFAECAGDKFEREAHREEVRVDAGVVAMHPALHLLVQVGVYFHQVHADQVLAVGDGLTDEVRLPVR
eukprot:Hpha_TRINITY_DN15949_c0_g3::TRINITY_DN15949_c0_g3_i1::g.75186::m.75186